MKKRNFLDPVDQTFKNNVARVKSRATARKRCSANAGNLNWTRARKESCGQVIHSGAILIEDFLELYCARASTLDLGRCGSIKVT